ncbi:MAG: hypothetical protein HKO54_09020 [Flavobacteriaceae bacterium]|nr:hypothetical protein [Flavobacteriaceae bacterium]
MRNNIFHILLFIGCSVLAQTQDSLQLKEERSIVVQDTLIDQDEYDPLAPSKAAFYSAVVPGLGQAYNKKYWKIPIIYVGIGSGIYFYNRNTKDYNRFRDAYKRRLAGFEDDEFQGISTDRLIDAQKNASRNRDVSIIVSIAFYILNIVDANVDAHLRQYNISDDLTLLPKLNNEMLDNRPSYGLAFKIDLK